MSKYYFDIESSNLLNASTVDYSQSPYKIKDNFNIHCISFLNAVTDEFVDFVGEDCYKAVTFIEDNVTELAGHNIIAFDLLVLKAVFGLDYQVASDKTEQDYINSKPINIVDTYILSKLYKPDREAHSIAYYGSELGLEKIDWRQKAIDLELITKADPKGAEYRIYHPEMLIYCQRDISVNKLADLYLQEESAGWDWSDAIILEKATAELTVRQEHFGFWFDTDLAYRLIEDLDSKLEERRLIVEPVLPRKVLTKAGLEKWTPPSRQLVYETLPDVPKQQVKKDGTPTQTMLRYAEKVGGTIEGDYDIFLHLVINEEKYPFSSTVPLDYWAVFKQLSASNPPTLSTNIENWVQKHNGFLHYTDEQWYANIEGNDYVLPIPCEPLKQQEPAYIQDVTHLKGWLCSMGWIPTQFKEKDLTVDTKKTKLTLEKYQETAQRYIDQTLESPFKKFRFEKLDVRSNTQFINKVLNHKLDRSLKVYTNPSLTVGMSKEIDPAIAAIADKFPYAKQVSEYLTYNHRRNSIASNGFVFDDYDEDDENNEPDAGFLASSRIYADGRIPTPADSNGCNTSRMKHRVICNICRNTSLYGEQMRSLFGVENRCLQLGFDLAALENRMQSHYVFRYDTEGKPYCN